MKFENAPAALNWIVLAVIGREVEELNRNANGCGSFGVKFYQATMAISDEVC
jgi:hypothetical protein